MLTLQEYRNWRFHAIAIAKAARHFAPQLSAHALRLTRIPDSIRAWEHASRAPAMLALNEAFARFSAEIGPILEALEPKERKQEAS